MKQTIQENILLFLFLFIVFALGVFALGTKVSDTIATSSNNNFTEPALPANAGTWSIQAIDTQIVSKDWPKVTQAAVHEQISQIAKLHPNYVAVGTPYDRVADMKLWVDEIHKQGMHVWFRSHWDQWQGDDGQPASMTPSEYLNATSDFIKNNPDLFQEGDSFTLAVEPEEVGIGLGKRFLTWDEYRTFVLNEVTVANTAFVTIGLGNKLYTNWISVNGWVVQNEFTKDVVDKLGLVTVDHYVYQSNTIGDYADGPHIVSQSSKDLDGFYKQWGKPILLGEWGYNIYQDVPQNIQAQVINNMYGMLKSKKYLVGVNYWAHMGNTSRLFGDTYGTNLQPRLAADVINTYYSNTSAKPTK